MKKAFPLMILVIVSLMACNEANSPGATEESVDARSNVPSDFDSGRDVTELPFEETLTPLRPTLPSSSGSEDASCTEGVCQLAMGMEHVCARFANGTVRCWGSNRYGQLGNGSTIDQPNPVEVTGLEEVVEIASGGNHMCARTRSGDVYCWGFNQSAQVGMGETSESVTTPRRVSGLSGAAELALGWVHSCARLTDGRVQCWGDNAQHQVGGGSELDVVVTPTVVPELSGVKRLSSQTYDTCALLDTGRVRCWGMNIFAHLGDSSAPVEMPGLEGVVQVSTGGDYLCFRLGSGVVMCWGIGAQRLMSTYEDANSIMPLMSDVLDFQAGTSHACARMYDGALCCWGDNFWGQVGDGTTEARRAPIEIQLPQQVEEVVTCNHSCARTQNGEVYCWGNNERGQVGDGTQQSRVEPVQVVW